MANKRDKVKKPTIPGSPALSVGLRAIRYPLKGTTDSPTPHGFGGMGGRRETSFRGMCVCVGGRVVSDPSPFFTSGPRGVLQIKWKRADNSLRASSKNYLIYSVAGRAW